MKRTSFLKKAKKLGLEVKENERRCYIHHNGTIASWFWQDSYSHPGEKEGTNWHTKGEGQESDPYTDYYPGTFWDNASQMLERLVPSGSKFKAGQLIRGKDNKRSARYGYVNRLGLVVETGSKQAKVQWVTPTEQELRLQRQWPATYKGTTWVSDRDLVVAA